MAPARPLAEAAVAEAEAGREEAARPPEVVEEAVWVLAEARPPVAVVLPLAQGRLAPALVLAPVR